MTANLEPGTMRWKCVCAYDGTHFSGWQSQTAGSAIQDVIEARLARILGGAVRIHAIGFPTQFANPANMQITGIRFATLMRDLSWRNNGTFVGLNDFR